VTLSIDVKPSTSTVSDKQEDWYGQWQWQCGFERGWDAAIERKREWAGLTKAEIDKIYYECGESAGYEYEQAIEAKLKEKNT
jgi:hypothetical protein